MTAESPAAMNRLFVVAGSWAEFNQWCRERQISPRDRSVMYVDDWTRLQGQPRGLRYIVVGTGWERRDIAAVRDALRWRDAVYGEAQPTELGEER